MKVTWGVCIVAVGTLCLSVAAAASGGPVSWAGSVAARAVGSWGNAIEVPCLAALKVGGNADAGSMSCGAAGNCTVGVYYTDSQGQQQGGLR